ncbi:MAG: hypothetical protein NZM43_02390 [Saprospiraceae bacterium]|nr:hypothetical protein [Saprospiraceae bacterium]MDW8483150.1 hypothetical protein [Saprospiraceae bacterium]
MRDLIELIYRLPWARLQASPVWNVILPPGTKMARLFSLVQESADLTEEGIAHQIYGTREALPRLRSLKNKTKERLLRAIFLLAPDEIGFSDRQEAYYECQRRWALALMLSHKELFSVAVEQLELVLRHAQHFEFTELAMSIALHLKRHYRIFMGNTQKYRYYQQLYRDYRALWLLENEAEERYADAINALAHTTASQGELMRIVEKHFRQVEPYLKTHTSFRLHLNGRLLHILVHSSRHDYQTVAKLCEDALTFFQSKPFRSCLPLQVFYYQLTVAYIHLRDFGRGRAVLQQHSNLYIQGSFNWYKVQELHFLLATHTQHYDEAFDVCQSVLREENFLKQPPQIRDTWKVYEAYAQLLACTRRADRLPNPQFRISKLINDLSSSPRERREIHIPLFIAQMLFLILNKRYDAAIDRIDALSKYTDRYVRKNERFRSNCFLKMLLQIPKAAFHRRVAMRKAQYYRNMLSQMPVEIANRSSEIEIIPYEDLWEMVLDMLPQERPSYLSKKARRQD